MSSAFLYLAIIAIWAGVLIPRWLKRDSSRAKAAKSSQPESPEAGQSPDELTDDEPVEVNAGADAGGAGVTMADGNAHVEAGSSRVADAGQAADAGRAAGRDRVAGADRVASASGARAADEAEAALADEAGLSGYEPEEPAGLPPADPQTRRRVLSARRRMLMLLIVLAAAAVGIALIGMAAWWVAIPPVAMLGGYLLLLREVRKADAERALIRADAEHRAEQQRLREAQEAAEVKQREEAQTARIIDISRRVRDELYDQYAEGERRAVGD